MKKWEDWIPAGDGQPEFRVCLDSPETSFEDWTPDIDGLWSRVHKKLDMRKKLSGRPSVSLFKV